MDQISTGIGIAGNFGLTTATTAPPPVPPRPFVGGTQPLSMSTFSGQVPTSYQPQFPAANFGNGYYNYYQPSLATSNNFLWPTPNQAQQPSALNLLNVAEESSRNAFRSLDTIVNAFVSVVNMLNSTHNAVFNSFRAVVGVVEQFRLLKHFMISQIFISLLRWARFLWRRLLAVLRLKPRNYASSEAIWTSIKEREAPVTMFNYVTLFFWLVAIGGPFLVYKCIMQAVLSDADSNKWAQGMGEHYTAQALYDFNTSNQNELSFTAFDMLRIAPKSKQPNIKDWLLASNFESSKIGLVPINYVKLLSRSNNETGDTEN